MPADPPPHADSVGQAAERHSRRAHPETLICPDPLWCAVYYGETFTLPPNGRSES